LQQLAALARAVPQLEHSQLRTELNQLQTLLHERLLPHEQKKKGSCTRPWRGCWAERTRWLRSVAVIRKYSASRVA
jgi:hypothetical protein